jgi:hypothetical protein
MLFAMNGGAMYEADTSQRGVYRISSLATRFSAVKRVLADAVSDPGEAFWEEYGRLDAEYRHAQARRDGDAHGGPFPFGRKDQEGFVDDAIEYATIALDAAEHARETSADTHEQETPEGVRERGASEAADGRGTSAEDAASADAPADDALPGSNAGETSAGAAPSGSSQGDGAAPSGSHATAALPDSHEAAEPSCSWGSGEPPAASAVPGGSREQKSEPKTPTGPSDEVSEASSAEPPSFEGLGGYRLWRTLSSDDSSEQDKRARALAGSYGWLGGVFPAPDEDGRYLVEFIDRSHVRILGYFDRAGRAWLTDEPLKQTPARLPQVDFARFSDCTEPDAELGCVEVREPDGTVRQVARYRRPSTGRIALYATWFDFGAYADGLTYDDAVARCFFAFCYRPGVIGVPVPTRGLVPAALVHIVSLARAFKIVVATARLAECDEALSVPGAYGMLADELSDAGALTVPDDAALALVREVHSGALEIVVMSNDDDAIAPAKAMALEHAINRYRLVCDDLGEHADEADRATVEEAAATILDRLVPAHPKVFAADRLAIDGAPARAADGAAQASHTVGAAACEPAADLSFLGEWNMRSDFSSALESLRTPYRGAVLFKSSLADGCAVLAAVVPPGAAMPAYRWDAGAGARVRLADAERTDEALRYALRFAVVVISKAFSSAPQIARVRFESGYYRADVDRPKGEEGSPRAVAVDVERTRFMNAPDPGTDLAALRELWRGLGGTASRSFDGERGFEDDENAGQDAHEQVTDAVRGDEGAGAPMTAAGDLAAGAADVPAAGIADALAFDPAPQRFDTARVFAPFLERPDIAALLDRPEAASGSIPPVLRSRLGADRIEDLRITASSARRRDAERLADALVGSKSDTDAVRRVRAFQKQANDPYALRACARVMTALLEGNLDLGDQNAVVNRYLGSDVCMRALSVSRNLRRDDPRAAVEVLTQAIAAAESQRAFSDTPEVACRVFDGYASRLLYNLDRAGTLPLGPDGAFIAAADRGRTVELVPDALYLCALEAERLMEGSFADTEEAIGCGKRAVQLAPTAAMGYRQLARSYMLVGDAESSIAELDRALRVATQVADVAVSYYQLAYVLGQERRLQAAVACYAKAIDMAPFIRRQAVLELHELLAREGAEMVPPDEVDHVLRAEGIVVAPTDAVLDALLEGSKAATDAGLFSCAYSLLGTYLRHRPDAALVDVLRSLSLEED